MVNRLRTIAIFLIISLQVHAQHDSVISAIDVYGFEHELAVTSKLSFFIDSLANSDINRVLRQNFQDSFRIYDDSLNQNPQKHIFWLKFGVKNISGKPLLVHLYCGDLDYIDLFFITDHKIDQKALGGELRRSSTSSSFIERTSMTLPLRIRAGQSGEIYIRYCQKSQEYNFGGIEIYDQENLYASYANDYEHSRYFVFFQQLFQGFLLCQLLYVLFQWMIIRRPEYLYYACYLLLIAVYFLSKYESIYGISFIFSKYPLLKIYLNKTLIISPYYFYFRFVRSFLEMRDNYPRLNRWIIWIEYFLLFYLAFDLVFIMTTFNIPLQRKIYTFILSIVFILATSFIFYLFGKKQALIYYILSGSLFVGVGNITGLILTYLDENEHVNLGFHNMLLFSQIGILLEIFCFTAGLSYKSKAAEKEKIKNQEELIEQLKANEALQTKMQGIRNKIAQDLHDDIGSTLSSISILSNLALKEEDSNQARETMSEIKESSINLMEKMDDIVWSINPRNDSLENLLMRIKKFATTLFEAKNIDYTISIQNNINEVKLPMEFRQHIYLIMKEAINNLVKYSQATLAYISVGYSDETLMIEVKDNGKGFLPHEMNGGNGLLSMKNRAGLMGAMLEINSIPASGTDILLKIKIK